MGSARRERRDSTEANVRRVAKSAAAMDDRWERGGREAGWDGTTSV